MSEERYIINAGLVPIRESKRMHCIEAFVSACWETIYECALCSEYDLETHENRSGHRICTNCAEHLANLYHHARSGDFLTWANPAPPEGVPGRQPITAALRRSIYERDSYRCRYCGGFTGGLVLDHVQPWSRGGEDTAENLVTACHACNSTKKDRTPDEAGMPLRPVPA